MFALTEWTTSSHFWIAVALPGVLSCIWGFSSRETLHAHAPLITGSLALTTASALWPMSMLTGWLDPDPSNVHAVAFFPLLYLVARRSPILNPRFCFAMTFWTLLYADLVASFYRAYQGLLPGYRFFVGIGGAGMVDGLVLFPALGALAAWLAAQMPGKGTQSYLHRRSAILEDRSY